MNQHEQGPQRGPEDNKPLGSPEHHKNVRQPMNYVKKSMLLCLLALVLTALLTASKGTRPRLEEEGGTGVTLSPMPSSEGQMSGWHGCSRDRSCGCP